MCFSNLPISKIKIFQKAILNLKFKFPANKSKQQIQISSLGPIFLFIQIALMILLEGFLVRPMIGITKNPSRRIINVIGMGRKIGH
jgi:hypothetical protein